MNFLLLTKSTSFIIGPIANIMGYIFEGIFNLLSFIGIENVGVSIIAFTIIINLLLLPLTIKQQKSTKLNAVVMPEVQAIQNKYKGKNDQESMARMQAETRAVYDKYGTSATSGCLPLLIQLPILYGLYRVIYNVPAYVPAIKNVYLQIVNPLIENYPSYATDSVLMDLASSAKVTGGIDLTSTDSLVDLLYTFTDTTWETLSAEFPQISDVIATNLQTINHMNNFLTINLRQNPTFTSISILIPILAGVSQWASTKLMSTDSNTASTNGNDAASQTAQTMKTMNTVMPLMSVFICFSLPSCVGLYWVASAVVRTVIQFFINKHFDKMDLDELVRRNMEKVNKKREKKGLAPNTISKTATTAVRNIKAAEAVTEEEKQAKIDAYNDRVKKATSYYTNGQAQPGSLAAKAGMVQQYNEKNQQKK